MRLFFLLAVCAIITSCGGGGGDGGTGPGPVVANLTLSPTTIPTYQSRGLTTQLTVVATDAGGNTINNPSVTFRSDNTAVATVSPAGLIASVGDGTTDIVATSGTASQSVRVTVLRRITRISLTPNPATVGLNQTQSLSVTAFDGNNQSMTSPAATFQSDDEDIATVSGSGSVFGVAVGSATITATAVTGVGTFQATSTVNVGVQNFPTTATVFLRGDSFDPSQVDIAAGGTVTFSNTSGVVHNVTFSAQASEIGNHASGNNPRTFSTPGTVGFDCNLHAGMSGTVVIH